MSKNKIVHAITCLESETVRIKWVLKDGNIYYEDYTCPPQATREVRQMQESHTEPSALGGEASTK